MGKTKKRFIDKKQSVTYALMARPGGEEDDFGGGPSNGSMLDGSAGGGGSEGTQVWMRKDNNYHVRDAMAEASGDDGSVFNDSMTETGTMYSGMTGMSGYSSMSNVTFIMGPNGPVPRRERLSREKRRELRELGFDPNDGYDYTRHLRKIGEGGGTMFVPTSKDHVRGVRQDPNEGKKSVKEEEVVYLREDVEENGMSGAMAIGEKDKKPAKDVEEETWTHEKIKAITDEMVYVAKDTTVANAIVAKATKAPHAGVAAADLEDMIHKMEEVELAQDEDLPNLKDEFDDGGLGDLQDDFILLAMGGEGDDAGATSSHSQKEFPPIRLRYDDKEVEETLATLEEIVEEEALEEEEEEIGNGGWFRGIGGRGGPGSDAGTDRDLDEEDWQDLDDDLNGEDRARRRRDDLGAEARDVDDAFEAMAGAYDSDEIGELDEDDPRIFGHAEIDRFGHVMDEWRKEHGTEQYKSAADVYYEGPSTPIGGKKKGSEVGEEDGEEDGEEEERDGHAFGSDDDEFNDYGVRRVEAPKITEEDVDDARGAMIAIRKRAGLPLPEHLMKEMTLGESGGSSKSGVPDEIARRYEIVEEGEGEEDIEYLKVDKKRDNWDCETIVSTYSNLENHPSLIDEPHGPSHGKRKKGGRRSGGGNGNGEDDVIGGAALIRLSASNGLPVDYVQSRRGRGRGGSLLTAENLAAVNEANEEEEEELAAGEGGEGEWEEYDEDDDMEMGEEWRQNIRRKGETPEEKKARKAAVKAGRKEARAAKKGLKTTFKKEENVMKKKNMVGDIRPGLSVTPMN